MTNHRHHENAVARVTQLISLGHVLCASNAVAGEKATVGTFSEAVDRGIRFACISVRGRTSEQHTKTADDAANIFVSRVGTGRANEAARKMARKHRIALVA